MKDEEQKKKDRLFRVMISFKCTVQTLKKRDICSGKIITFFFLSVTVKIFNSRFNYLNRLYESKEGSYTHLMFSKCCHGKTIALNF